MKLEISNRWKQIQLEKLLEFVIGGDWGKDEMFEDENFASAYCIRGSEIKKWDEEKGKTASLRKVKRSSIDCRKLKVGDILIEISGGGPEQPVGRTVLIDTSVLNFEPDIPKICTNFLRLIRPINGIDSKFLNYYLKLFYISGEIVKCQGGSNNLRNLKFPDFIKILVPLPTLPEQQSIVSKIEELLSDLENGKQQLLLAQQQLKVYRQSLLKAAFEGRLTSVASTSSASESSTVVEPVETTVKDSELPKGWRILKLKDITIEKEGLRRGPFGSSIKKEFFVLDGYKVYEQGNAINDDPYRGKYFVDDVKYQELINFKVLPGDLIVSCSGVTLGRICELPTDAKAGIINQALLRIRLKKDLILNKYFVLHFRGAFFQKRIFAQSQGTAMPNLVGLKDFKEIDMYVPPIEEQKIILQKLESKLTVCDKIEETLNLSLQQAETLRQSILKKAFEGKLIQNS
jgi:type I restriction enzyme, S subunit